MWIRVCLVVAGMFLMPMSAFALTEEQRAVVTTQIELINRQVNLILKTRDEMQSVLDIEVDIANDVTSLNVLARSQARAKLAAEALATILTPR